MTQVSKIKLATRFFSLGEATSLGKSGDLSRVRPEGSLFNSDYTEVQEKALLLSLNCST